MNGVGSIAITRPPGSDRAGGGERRRAHARTDVDDRLPGLRINRAQDGSIDLIRPEFPDVAAIANGRTPSSAVLLPAVAMISHVAFQSARQSTPRPGLRGEATARAPLPLPRHCFVPARRASHRADPSRFPCRLKSKGQGMASRPASRLPSIVCNSVE